MLSVLCHLYIGKEGSEKKCSFPLILFIYKGVLFSSVGKVGMLGTEAFLCCSGPGLVLAWGPLLCVTPPLSYPVIS